MVWFLLGAAIAAEVVGTTALKLSNGFSKLAPSLFAAVGYVTSFGLLSLALKKLEVSVAYAIWSGVGTAAVATIGVLAMKESLSVTKVAGLLLIIGGVALLNLAGSH